MAENVIAIILSEYEDNANTNTANDWKSKFILEDDISVIINRIEEYDWSQTGTLMSQNLIGGKNNQQLIDVVKYYNL